MDRRALLKLLSATALVGCTDKPVARRLKVVIAGAGIVGAALAYRLAVAGATVTIIDREGPASHASLGTFAWINATWAKQPRSYHTLTQRSVMGWGALQSELNIPIKWGGSLEWFASTERNTKLVAQIAEQADWGEPARMIGTQEIANLEPNLVHNTADKIAFSGNDGAVDPVAATQALLAGALKLGAQIIYPCVLQGTNFQKGRLISVDTSSGQIAADRLVLATGADERAPEQFADAPIPQRTTPGIIAITKPMAPLLNRIISAPGIHMHQRVDGRIVLGEQDGAPDNEAHALRLNGRPNQFPVRSIAQQHAARMIETATSYLPGIKEAVVENVYIGWRPLPLDGHPVIGASPNRPDVYLAIMHSGVSLAPIASQLAAIEIMNNDIASTLNEFRPGRVFTESGKY